MTSSDADSNVSVVVTPASAHRRVKNGGSAARAA
jgi:hypothetical protein